MQRLTAYFGQGLRSAVLVLCLVAAARPGEAAEPLNPWEQELSLGLGTDYSSGRYGSHKRTDSVSVPLTLEWRPHQRVDIQLSLPYIYQSNSVNPAFKRGGGSGSAAAATQAGVGQSPQGLPAGSGQGGQGQPGAGSQGGQGQPGTGTGPKFGQDTSQNGIGDMTLQVGIAAVEEEGVLPQLRLLGYVKFPTGNRADWLGSGEFDEGAGLSLAKSFGDLQLYLEGIWIFQGGSAFLEESGITVRDYLSYFGELGYQVTESLVPALVLKGTSPTSDESGGTVEGQLKLSWRINDHFSSQAYVGTGFTTSSPDLTAGASLFYNF